MAGSSRRDVLVLAAGLGVGVPAAAGRVPGPAANGPPDWEAVARLFDRPRGIVHLEHGQLGMMARPVRDAWQAASVRLGRETALYARGEMWTDLEHVRRRLAAFLAVRPEEVALCRNATEGLRALILGYRPLSQGEAVVTADLDYDSMIHLVDALAAGRGGRHVRLALPEPASRQALIDTYAEALVRARPVRLLLLTQVSHRTGLVLPVREIVALARAHGADCIVDAAHGVGQLEATVGDLDADFVGFNCHKWLGAPPGTAGVYIRAERLADIAEDAAAAVRPSDRIEDRVHPATHDWAALLALGPALDLVEATGPAHRAARLRALRDRWVEPLRGLDGLEILTPEDPALHAGITSFRIRGRARVEENAAIARELFDRFGVLTVARNGPARGACVRVTPALATQEEEVDVLCRALPGIVRRWRI